jgi:hypothetical protein
MSEGNNLQQQSGWRKKCPKPLIDAQEEEMDMIPDAARYVLLRTQHPELAA